MGSVFKVIENKIFLSVFSQHRFGRIFAAALCSCVALATVASACPSAAKSGGAEKSNTVKPNSVEDAAAPVEKKAEAAAQISIADESSRGSLGTPLSDSATDKHRNLGRHGRTSMTRERTLRD